MKKDTKEQMDGGKNNVVIEGSEFNCFKFDKPALATLDKVAQALLNLTRLFSLQNVDISVGTMLSLGESINGRVSNSCFTMKAPDKKE
jgi:hypothetical protein